MYFANFLHPVSRAAFCIIVFAAVAAKPRKFVPIPLHAPDDLSSVLPVVSPAIIHPTEDSGTTRPPQHSRSPPRPSSRSPVLRGTPPAERTSPTPGSSMFFLQNDSATLLSDPDDLFIVGSHLAIGLQHAKRSASPPTQQAALQHALMIRTSSPDPPQSQAPQPTQQAVHALLSRVSRTRVLLEQYRTSLPRVPAPPSRDPSDAEASASNRPRPRFGNLRIRLPQGREAAQERLASPAIEDAMQLFSKAEAAVVNAEAVVNATGLNAMRVWPPSTKRDGMPPEVPRFVRGRAPQRSKRINSDRSSSTPSTEPALGSPIAVCFKQYCAASCDLGCLCSVCSVCTSCNAARVFQSARLFMKSRVCVFTRAIVYNCVRNRFACPAVTHALCFGVQAAHVESLQTAITAAEALLDKVASAVSALQHSSVTAASFSADSDDARTASVGLRSPTAAVRSLGPLSPRTPRSFMFSQGARDKDSSVVNVGAPSRVSAHSDSLEEGRSSLSSPKAAARPARLAPLAQVPGVQKLLV